MVVNKTCPICKKDMKIGQDIAVLSYPLRIVGQNSEYSFEQFMDNEVSIHFDCLKINKGLPTPDKKKAVYDSVCEIIKQLGEKKIDKNKLLKLVSETDEANIPSLIKSYFQNNLNQTSPV